MAKYADRTDVPVSRSKQEIEELMTRFGCVRFASISEPQRAAIMFEYHDFRYRVMLPLPHPRDHTRDKSGYGMTVLQQKASLDAETRRRWRSLLLVLKSKLVAVEDGISTMEEEFLANLVLPSGETIGERIVPEARRVATTGDLPPLLPGLPTPGRVIALADRTGS